MKWKLQVGPDICLRISRTTNIKKHVQKLPPASRCIAWREGGWGENCLPIPFSYSPPPPPPLPFRCLPWSLFTEAHGLFLLMVILTNACKHHCSSLYYPWSPGGGGGGEGGTQQSFTWEGSAPGLAPYPCKPFQNVLLSYTFNRQIVPLSHTSFRPLHPF